MKRQSRRVQKRRPKWLIITLSVILAVVVTAIIGMALYVQDYYHADAEVSVYLPGDASGLPENVTVSTLSEKGITQADGLFYDGPGQTKALIFYPGAKVEYTAYAPLMARIAEDGIDCFLIQMPLNLAFTNSEAAAYVMNAAAFSDTYSAWIIGGHSLGGAIASEWVYNNLQDQSIKGVLFLASYPIHDLSRADFSGTGENDLHILSIYGSKDGVLNRSKLEQGKEYMNSLYRKIAVINGGNHAQFADYGPQKGDGEATITRQDQQTRTAELIKTFFADVP